jgi:hypothetical protein
MTSRPSISPISLAVVSALAFVAACGSEHLSSPSAGVSPVAATASHGGSEWDAEAPQFLTAAAGAPSIANPVIAFWAKKGNDTTVVMYYHARPGHNDSTTFMRFRVRAKSLLSRPDGTLIAKGDSVLITVTLSDPAALTLDFQPSGLRFSSHDQAELKMSFREATPIDSTRLRALCIWSKESALDPWLRLSSTVERGAKQVQANIGGFTGYAMAY